MFAGLCCARYNEFDMSAIHSTVNGILMTNLANYGGPTCYFCGPNSAETYTVDCENVR